MPTTEPPIICPSKARGESKEGTPRGIKEALFSKAGDAKKETIFQDAGSVEDAFLLDADYRIAAKSFPEERRLVSALAHVAILIKPLRS